MKEVTAKYIKAEITQPDGSKTSETIPYGLLVWATGNAVRPVIKDLMNQLPAQASSRRGLLVDEHLRVKGADGIFAVGDCAITNFAPTAQVASQEGSYLAKHLSALARTATLEAEISELNARRASAPSAETRAAVDAQLARTDRHLRKVKAWTPFEYSHQGSLAYIGKDKAIADISWFDGNFATGGSLTYLFWRSAYLSMCFSTRNRMLVLLDWTKCKVFGRDVSRE